MTEIEALEHCYQLLLGYGEAQESEHMVKLRDVRDSIGYGSVDSIDEFTKGWEKLFPDGKELESHGVGDKALIDPEKIRKKMRTFFKEFARKTNIRCKYEDKCRYITDATVCYINKFRTGKSEWIFIMHADNFISHHLKGSELARIIVALKAKPVKDSKVVDFNYRMA